MSTKTKRNSGVDLAVSQDNQLFIKVQQCGISPLVVLVDALPLTFFGKGKTPYIRVERALQWFEDELPHDPQNKLYPQAIAKYRDILRRFEAGELICKG